MSQCQQSVEEWIGKNQQEMIYCPHQPGRLIISKKGCIKRYLAAKNKAFEAISEEDPYHYIRKKGLLVCESCPIGRRYYLLEYRQEAA